MAGSSKMLWKGDTKVLLSPPQREPRVCLARFSRCVCSAFRSQVCRNDASLAAGMWGNGGRASCRSRSIPKERGKIRQPGRAQAENRAAAKQAAPPPGLPQLQPPLEPSSCQVRREVSTPAKSPGGSTCGGCFPQIQALFLAKASLDNWSGTLRTDEPAMLSVLGRFLGPRAGQRTREGMK